MEKMRYIGGTSHGPNASRLTVGDVYEVLVWFNPGATMLNGLVRDKDGALYAAQTFNDPAEWTEVKPAPVPSAPVPSASVANAVTAAAVDAAVDEAPAQAPKKGKAG